MQTQREPNVCMGCGVYIEWVKTKAGKSMPVDPAGVTIVTKEGETVRGYIPHWATCPKAKLFKRGYDKAFEGKK